MKKVNKLEKIKSNKKKKIETAESLFKNILTMIYLFIFLFGL